MRLVAELSIPLPPIEVQKRIVAKVDELMTLCDQLEQQTETSLEAHNLLVDTLLATLTDARDALDLSDNWARLADHFDTLITTDYAVEQLKQTILQLAVMGKLVPQDPNDEPARELLKRIANEKEQLIRDNKIKKQKPLPGISDEEKPFELPRGWVWSKVGDIALLKGGFAYKSKEFITESDFQVIRMGNIRPDFFRLNENPVYITATSAETTNGYQVAERDILLTMTGTKGKRDYLYSLVVKKSDINTRSLYLNQRLCIVRPLEVNEMFLNLVMKNDHLLDFIYSKSTGTANQANIGMEAIMNWVIPMPSLSEQQRIVANVDELMTLCDQLKTNLKNSQCIQLQLTDAVIYGVVGEPTKNNSPDTQGVKNMKITTMLTLNSDKVDKGAVIAPLILEMDGSADAKDVWAKTKLTLPEFYAQLKIEIDAGYISKPARADFNEV